MPFELLAQGLLSVEDLAGDGFVNWWRALRRRRWLFMMNARCRLGSEGARFVRPLDDLIAFKPIRDAGHSAQRIMFNAYVIEIDDEAVGIAARDQSGYRFHAAAHAFNALDGRLFTTVREAAAAARALSAGKPMRKPDVTRRRAPAFM